MASLMSGRKHSSLLGVGGREAKGLQGLNFAEGWALSSAFPLGPQKHLFEWPWVVLIIAISRRDPHRARENRLAVLFRVTPSFRCCVCCQVPFPLHDAICLVGSLCRNPAPSVTGVRCKVKTFLPLTGYGEEGPGKRTGTPSLPTMGPDRKAQGFRGWLSPRVTSRLSIFSLGIFSEPGPSMAFNHLGIQVKPQIWPGFSSRSVWLSHSSASNCCWHLRETPSGRPARPGQVVLITLKTSRGLWDRQEGKRGRTAE